MSDVAVQRGAVKALTPLRFGWWYVAEWRLRGMRSYRWTILLMTLGNPVLYLAAMGIGLGALVRVDVAGVSYLHFVAPALLVSTTVAEGFNEASWPVMSGFRWQKFYLGMSATPLAPVQLAMGESVAVSLRLWVQSFTFWLIGLAFGAFDGLVSILIVPIAVGAAMATHAVVMAYVATIDNDVVMTFMYRMIMMPMFLFAGTFYPLETMPVFLQWIGWISPMWHGSQLARVVAIGLPEPGWLIACHVGFLAVWTIGGLLWARRTFTKRVVV